MVTHIINIDISRSACSSGRNTQGQRHQAHPTRLRKRRHRKLLHSSTRNYRTRIVDQIFRHLFPSIGFPLGTNNVDRAGDGCRVYIRNTSVCKTLEVEILDCTVGWEELGLLAAGDLAQKTCGGEIFRWRLDEYTCSIACQSECCVVEGAFGADCCGGAGGHGQGYTLVKLESSAKREGKSILKNKHPMVPNAMLKDDGGRRDADMTYSI